MLNRRKLNCAEAKKIPIVDFLASLGYFPINEKRNDCYYLSPLRTESNPSFRVNRVINIYYDYGIAEGGTIIDLGTKLLNCSIETLLEKLTDLNFSPVQQNYIYIDNSIKIIEVKEISSPALLSYIQERAIKKEIAQLYCVEVHFEMNSKKYYAIGFQNISSGFELRNKYFKGSSSPKDISIIKNNANKLCVFEGFFDFLSYFGSKLEMPGTFDFLVLNSISFLAKSFETIKKYEEVYLFLDNDHAGSNGASKITNLGLQFCIDKSLEYNGSKDFNEHVIKERKPLIKKRSKPFNRSIGLGM
jgi:hypothetical protein